MAEEIIIDTSLSKADKYEQLLPQIEALISGESDLIANLANIASVLKYHFNFFWVGFYLFKDNELVLGPFQGPIACTRIKIGKGVCGTSFEKKETIIVPNVNEFAGHIACSSETQSEIVLSIIVNNEPVAVLDVDSEMLDHFDTIDQQYLEQLTLLISNKW